MTGDELRAAALEVERDLLANGDPLSGTDWSTMQVVRAYLADRTPKPLDDWHEDDGDALWWELPVKEPPYVGSPLWNDWPGYHTHWTPIPLPVAEKS